MLECPVDEAASSLLQDIGVVNELLAHEENPELLSTLRKCSCCDAHTHCCREVLLEGLSPFL